MEILNHPYLLLLAIFLSAISTYYCYRGFREKHVPSILIGIGVGVPTFDMLSAEFWIIGVLITVLGIWLRGKMESI